MLVLIVFIICSAMFYLYYKAKNVRTNRPVEKNSGRRNPVWHLAALSCSSV